MAIKSVDSKLEEENVAPPIVKFVKKYMPCPTGLYHGHEIG